MKLLIICKCVSIFSVSLFLSFIIRGFRRTSEKERRATRVVNRNYLHDGGKDNASNCAEFDFVLSNRQRIGKLLNLFESENLPIVWREYAKIFSLAQNVRMHEANELTRSRCLGARVLEFLLADSTLSSAAAAAAANDIFITNQQHKEKLMSAIVVSQRCHDHDCGACVCVCAVCVCFTVSYFINNTHGPMEGNAPRHTHQCSNLFYICASTRLSGDALEILTEIICWVFRRTKIRWII